MMNRGLSFRNGYGIFSAVWDLLLVWHHASWPERITSSSRGSVLKSPSCRYIRLTRGLDKASWNSWTSLAACLKAACKMLWGEASPVAAECVCSSCSEESGLGSEMLHWEPEHTPVALCPLTCRWALRQPTAHSLHHLLVVSRGLAWLWQGLWLPFLGLLVRTPFETHAKHHARMGQCMSKCLLCFWQRPNVHGKEGSDHEMSDLGIVCPLGTFFY